ncbi:MAG: VWA domain-containing protein [Bacteroidales bacterium]|jgi:Ca-activated chloride channel family protein|nr:VWA domain-containing protein [Bacteroidales bacterium]MCI2136351.1 VWA domain-containing protein [Bacteroidales bacterium]MDY6385229.1 VWA domain-containing protein [Bacteroidales bacterium]
MKRSIALALFPSLLTIVGSFLGSCSISSDSPISDSYYGMNGNIDCPGSGGDKYDQIVENPFVKTADENVSTFSVDADGASYANMRRYLMEGMLPDKNSVRTEEFLNYFTFDYPDPADGKTVAINSETGVCPWNSEHYLLRLGIKGKSVPESEVPQANFVFLIDISGSMDSDDKLPLLKNSLMTLVDYLRPTDRISIVTYAGGVEKILESTPVSEASTIKKAIKKLSAYGSTSGGAGMKMAYEEAKANFKKGGNNRVIMGTDGDFNVGVTDTDELKEMVQDYAKGGIYLTCCGFGRGNLNDSMMETVSNWGNGTYEYIDSEGEMTKVFVNERSKFYSVANDSKCQVTFDKDMVEAYRLIGYENRKLENDDFENDDKDAGEIGAGQTITALYEIIPGKAFEAGKSVAKFDFRYKESIGSQSIALSNDVMTQSSDQLSENLSFAAGVAAYAMLLRNSEYKGKASFNMATELVKAGQGKDPHGYRKQLLELIAKAKSLNN